jgi:ornithine cyclodeaminase
MVAYLGTKATAAMVARIGPGEFTQALADRIERDFRRWPEFETSARLASHSARGVIELMPTSDGRRYAFKYVNGHPANTQEGLLTVTAFGVLADVATGYPLLVSEMTLLTAIRTAATSAMAARTLAREGASRMALIGAGAQAEFQAIAFHRVCGVARIDVFDPDRRAVARLQTNLAGLAGLEIAPAASAAEACQHADIITTATAAKSRAAVLTRGMVKRGVHINAIGGDCPGKTELERDVLEGARIFVEYAPQTRIEGEIQQLPPDAPVTELWRVLRGEAQGRRNADEITLFDSVGFAIEDFSALEMAHEVAARLGAAAALDLVPQLADPKNLFGLLTDAVGVFHKGIDERHGFVGQDAQADAICAP